MKLIVGLGNPGTRYADTRHNIGFLVLRQLCADAGIVLRRDLLGRCQQGRGMLEATAILCALPLSYMNRSGAAVSRLLKRHRTTLQDLLVVCDDIDLAFGRIRIKPSGSSGGHRGLGSVIEALGGDSGFARLRCGVGRPQEGRDAAQYVLEPFSAQERQELPAFIREAAACCRLWATEGIEGCMNRFNTHTVSSTRS